MKSSQILPEASTWTKVRNGDKLQAEDKQTLFIDQCKILASENSKIANHVSNNALVRVVTYNVHFWTDPYSDYQTAKISEKLKIICQQQNIFSNSKITPIFDVIDSLNADILILEEVSSHKIPGRMEMEEFEDYKKILFSLGYIYGLEQNTSYEDLQFFGNTIITNNMKDFKASPNGPFGNWIISKLPFIQNPIVKHFDNQHKYAHESRCYVHCIIQLPNNQILSVYGTHLDVYNEKELIRFAQITELLDTIRHDNCDNILIAGDFNSIRCEDYTSEQFELIIQENLRRGAPTQTLVANTLKTHGFIDCFTMNNQITPKFTAWAGTTIDFIILKCDTWRLTIDNCYVYFDAASDHLPVVMDLRF
jgi:endonuclease/exonuclease/phosphatase family metal-dependent hydrolase